MQKILVAVFLLLTVFTSSADAAIERQKFITTIEPAVIFTFGGLSRKSSVEDILNRMDENHMRGTFFVTERELKRNKENIDLIVAHGQELGIGLRVNVDPKKPDNCQSLQEQIQRIRGMLREYYGIVKQNTYFAIGVKFSCLVLGAVGIANMWYAIFADVGVMVLAVLNAIRALYVKNV